MENHKTAESEEQRAKGEWEENASKLYAPCAMRCVAGHREAVAGIMPRDMVHKNTREAHPARPVISSLKKEAAC